MRVCKRCGGGLKQGRGWERSAAERGGNPDSVDEFHCTGCGLLYLHSYEERFTGDIEGWAVRTSPEERWQHLPEAEWPTYGTPRRK